VGSVAITELGLLNVTLAAERAAYNRPVEERHRGIPYPGTFFLDEDGIVTGKRFEQSHRVRPTGRTLLAQLTGDAGDTEPVVVANAESTGVRLVAWLDTDVVHANQLQEAHVRIELDDDAHLYTEPVPSGFRALSVSIQGDDRLHVEAVPIPPGREFHVTGLEDTFYVLDGPVEVTVPFFLGSDRDTAGDGVRPVSLSVVASYQACTGDECFFPEQVRLDLDLSEHPNPGYESVDAEVLSPLVFRRIVESPRTEDELLELVNAALQSVDASAQDIAAVLADLEAQGMLELGEDGLWIKT